MDYYERLEPRTTKSLDEYSPFYFAYNHFSFPEIETPPSLHSASGAATIADNKKRSARVAKGSVSTASSSKVHPQDPLLQSSSYGTSLIIGRSGTGKSSLLKTMIRSIERSKQLYLVNVRGDEQREYEKLHKGGEKKVSPTTLAGLPSIKPDSVVIVEDIISMKEKDQIKLREAVNYTAHHKQCKLFCVTHTVFKTGIFSLMPLFTNVIFTNSRANGPILRQTFSQFSVPKPDVEKNLRVITETSESEAREKKSPRHLYFFIDCARMTLGAFYSDRLNSKPVSLGPIISEVPSVYEADKQNSRPRTDHSRFSDSPKPNRLLNLFFPPAHEHHSKILGIFHLINSSPTALRHLNSDTLTFSFRRRRKNRNAKAVSLVDYFNCAWNPSAVPSRETHALHRFLTKECKVPQSIVTNRRLLNSSQT